MNILGLSAFYHESACCLLQDGHLVAAAAEERFTRVKHDPRLPVRAYRYCMQTADLNPANIDVIAYYEDPFKKAARQNAFGHFPPEINKQDPHLPERMIREYLGYDGPIYYFDHHLSHAASAYYFSGFDDAAILTADGIGEWATTTYGSGQGDNLTLFEEVPFPNSLGLFYAAITTFLGFGVNRGEPKVMGLAAYGRPRFVREMRTLLRSGPKGQFTLDMDYFNFGGQEALFLPTLCELLGYGPRQPESEIEPYHQDIACSAQLVLEELLLEKVDYLAGQRPSSNLCLAGGVALNAVANGHIRRESRFENLFIQPAPGDAGGCLGAAALAHHRLTGKRPRQKSINTVRLGPQFNRSEIALMISAMGVECTLILRDRKPNLYKRLPLSWRMAGLSVGFPAEWSSARGHWEGAAYWPILVARRCETS